MDIDPCVVHKGQVIDIIFDISLYSNSHFYQCWLDFHQDNLLSVLFVQESSD